MRFLVRSVRCYLETGLGVELLVLESRCRLSREDMMAVLYVSQMYRAVR